MQFDPSEMHARDIYQWMTRLINPRPIAWVSSLSKQGIANLAPFSFFNGIGAIPPTLVFCPANKRDGSPKDTLLNIQEVGEFVVNVVTLPLAQEMHATAQEFDREVDEFEFVSIAKEQSVNVTVPRVAASLASSECQLHQVISLASGPGAANLVIGRIVGFSVADELFDSEGCFQAEHLSTIGRMGDQDYSNTLDRFRL